MKTIIFTGGHHNSALEIAKVLQKKGYHIVWVGHKHTIRDDTSLSFEYQEVRENNIKFIELHTGKFYNPSGLTEWLRIPGGMWQALNIVKEYKPKLIVAFGGYLSTPVVLAGAISGVKIVCHEQTVKAGWANRVNAIFAQKVFITWPESFQWFPIDKTIVTGLPLRKTNYQKLTKIVDFSNKLPTLLITGGKQGSHIINVTISKIYPQLLTKYNIIHQTGGLKITGDYQRLLKIKKKLPKGLQKRLFLEKYFFQSHMCQALNQADLVVCRAGAHTVYELLSLGKPALFIPLRLSITKEQWANAEKAKSLKVAEVLLEEQLNAKTLFLKIEEVFQDLSRHQRAGRKAKTLVKKDATKTIVAEIEKLL